MLNDLDIYNKSLNKKIFIKLKNNIKENNFIFGDSVKKFENKLSNYTGSKYTITVGSGTDALLLSLMSLNLNKNDEVIIPSFSWLSVLEVVLLLGLKFKFVDTCLNSFNLDIKSLKKSINKNTKVIISTSLFGRSVDLIELKKICKKNKIILIEDGAQNFGSRIGNLSSLNIADLTCTSFFPSKNLGCYGDGGAIFTNKKSLAEKLKKLRNHGQSKYNESELLGINSRLGSLQATVLIEKLKDIKNKKKKQVSLYKRYEKFFNNKKIIGFPIENIYRKLKFDNMYCQFSILVKKRGLLIKYLKKYRIDYKIYYSKPLYNQFSIKKKYKLKNTEYICNKIISLPFNDISVKRQKKTFEVLNKIINFDRGIFFEKK